MTQITTIPKCLVALVLGAHRHCRPLPAALPCHAGRAWYKWLNRRSQRTRWTWKRFLDLVRDFPLPSPRVMVRIGAESPQDLLTVEPDGGNLHVRIWESPGRFPSRGHSS